MGERCRVAGCPQGFGNPWDGARATVGGEGGGGRGANRELDTGILFWTESASASDGKSVKLS